MSRRFLAIAATGALDDAMRAAGIPWRGNWDPSFHDFFIDRVGPYASAAPDSYWSLTVNGRFASGGCLAPVVDGDSVRFFYGPLFGAGPPAVPGSPKNEAGGPGGGDEATAPDAGPAGKATRGVAARAARYLGRNPDGIGAGWGRLALALRTRVGPANAAAADLIPGGLDELRGSSLDGDVNATALAVLALAERHPRRAAGAAAWLASVQDPGGGFGFRPGIAPDVDTTGLATWALAVADRMAAARRAATFVRSTQAGDGGFPSLPGGSSNSQSTGLALVALRVAGIGPRVRSDGGATPLDFLSSLARPNGAIAYAERSNPTPTWTTAQALLGLTSRSRLLSLQPQ